MSLVFPDYDTFKALASITKIQSQDTKQAAPFLFNEEQEHLANLILREEAHSVIVLKGRQIGTSTFFTFLDLCLAIINPRITVGIAVDTDDKAKELLARVKAHCQALAEAGLPTSPVVSNTRKIQLANGSEIHAFTAGNTDRAGRSLTYHVLHLTELPFWQNESAYQSIMSSAPDAPVFLETTAKGAGDLLWHLWTESPKYEKVFFSVEQHSAYTAAPEKITEDEWTYLQERFGFTSRPHASWWLNQLKDHGDEILQLHDYPIVSHHPFTVSKDRWVKRDPKPANFSLLQDIQIFEEPLPGHKYVAGVDSAAGKSRDACAIALLDKSTKRLVASYKDNQAEIDDLIQRMKWLHQKYNVDYFVVEDNGIGAPTVQYARKESLPVVEHHQNEGNKYAGLLAAKREIEAEAIYGPADLAEECASLTMDEKGKFKGKKDLLVSIGFALLAIEKDPYALPYTQDSRRYYQMNRSSGKESRW